MAFGLGTSNNIGQWAGIDTTVVNQVSGQILSNAQAAALSPQNLAQFKRPELGANLYDGRMSADIQRQIASNNGILNAIQSPDIKLLMAKAASTVYAPLANPKAEEPTVELLSRNVFLQMTDKDKKGSNPFTASSGGKSEVEQSEMGYAA